MYKKIGLILIVISILGIAYLKIKDFIDYKQNSIIIDNIFKEGKINTFDYIGYIEIKSLNIKRGIIYGITDDNLNKNLVTLDRKSNSLEDSNIVLAGHSINNVFGKLHYIENGMIIKITSFYDINYYEVYDKKVVNKDEIESLKGDLCLITCMANPNKRLIVYAKKVSN